MTCLSEVMSIKWVQMFKAESILEAKCLIQEDH
jgi:hypothetical protein